MKYYKLFQKKRKEYNMKWKMNKLLNVSEILEFLECKEIIEKSGESYRIKKEYDDFLGFYPKTTFELYNKCVEGKEND